jgi:cobalt-zinc-cadmium resistance protein CzcA
VFEALERNNRSVGGGYIEHEREQYLVRGEGLLESLEGRPRPDVVVGGRRRAPRSRSRLAKVELAPIIRQGAVTRDGEARPSPGIVMMLMGANSRDRRDATSTPTVEEIQRSLPEGVSIDTFYDRTELIDRTIRTVGKNLLEGGALVVIVLVPDARRILRPGSSCRWAIPLSMLVAASAMRLGSACRATSCRSAPSTSASSSTAR